MAITSQLLSQCTDDQINKGVAWLTVKDMCRLTDRLEYQKFMSISIMNNISRYCNDPGDIMPIAFANGISLLHDFGVWEASFDFYGTEKEHGTDEMLSKWVNNKNPLRAICEVYILMSVSK